MGFFSVKDWDEFQHYKDRNPPWIRFYNSVLDNYEIGRLQDASKAHLFAIWLLASRYENRIPHDSKWVASKINATSPVDLQTLEKLGLIIVEQDASTAQAECAPEQSRAETISKRKRLPLTYLSLDWKPTDDNCTTARELTLTDAERNIEIGKFRSHFIDNPNCKEPRKRDWNRAFDEWLKRGAPAIIRARSKPNRGRQDPVSVLAVGREILADMERNERGNSNANLYETDTGAGSSESFANGGPCLDADEARGMFDAAHGAETENHTAQHVCGGNQGPDDRLSGEPREVSSGRDAQGFDDPGRRESVVADLEGIERQADGLRLGADEAARRANAIAAQKYAAREETSRPRVRQEPDGQVPQSATDDDLTIPSFLDRRTKAA